MLLSEFPHALEINPCPRKIVCNTYEVIHMSGFIWNDDKNIEDGDEYGFTGSFFKKAPIIIDDNIKKQLMKIQRTPKTILMNKI